MASPDKRDIAKIFRERLAQLVSRETGGLSGFAREAGIDRSALNQFLHGASPRLPRAETLCRIAEARGVPVDWLLGLSNTTEVGQAIAPTVEIETAFHEDGTNPLDRWRQEAVGQKIRYVPAGLPDMLALPEAMDIDIEPARAVARRVQGANILTDVQTNDSDLEIAMPRQTLDDLAEGNGVWRDLDQPVRHRQLIRMAELCERHYPRMRLHLFDARRTYSAPFTVFGKHRAALYLGRNYLVLTASDQIRALAAHFDALLREAVIGPDRVHLTLLELARKAGAVRPSPSIRR